MLGLGLQATLRPKAEGAARPVQDGLVLADNFRKSPVNDELGLTFPSNGSAEFNGTSDYISIGTPMNETLGSVAFWIYKSSATNSATSGYYPIDFQAGVGEHALTLGSWTGALANEVISLGAQTPSAWRIGWTTTDSNAIPAGWNHIAITQTSGTYSIYLNGSSLPVTTYGTPVEITIENINIGVREDAGSSFVGWVLGNLANVAIWNRALTSDEINSVMWKGYDSLTASEQNGLQAWYALDNITGTDVPDSTGNYNGTAY
jgi:hypothetical protein